MPKPLFRILTKQFFIVTNIVVGLFFLIGCYAQFIFTPQVWWVGLFSLAIFYFFIILVLFFIFWLFAASKWALLFFVLVFFSWKQLLKIIPIRQAETFSMHKKPTDLRIMSWNVAQFDILNYKKNPSVKHNMIDLINQYQPDIACFQEMVAGDSIIDLNNAYYRRFPFFALSDFETALHFADEYYSYNWKENFLISQHFGVVIFSKYPIIDRHTITTYPNEYNAIFQYVDIVKEGDTIRVFNIHLQSLKFSRGNLLYIGNPSFQSETDLRKSKKIMVKLKIGFLKRQAQAEKIKAEIDKSPYPVIVCGDFNDVPNSYAYETIGRGLQNAFEKKGSGLGRTFSGIAPTLRIDQIFVDSTYQVNQYTRIEKKLSDHFPIITDITRLPKAAL